MSAKPSREIAELSRAQTLLFQARRRGGPLPPPADLEHYERICPGAADRILKVMEREQTHRQELTQKVIDVEVVNAKRALPISRDSPSSSRLCAVVPGSKEKRTDPASDERNFRPR